MIIRLAVKLGTKGDGLLKNLSVKTDIIKELDPDGVYLTETGISIQGFEQMICNISGKKDLGHIVLCASNSESLILCKSGIFRYSGIEILL